MSFESDLPIYVLSPDLDTFMNWRKDQPGPATKYRYVSTWEVLKGMNTFRVVQLEGWWLHDEGKKILGVLSTRKKNKAGSEDLQIDIAIEMPENTEKKAVSDDDALIDALPAF